MKVIVSAQRIGWHKYPGHPTLGQLHRHLFKGWAVFAEKESREIEFFEAQAALYQALKDLALAPGDDSPLSCEEIGKAILRKLLCSQCIVSEDGENSVLVDRADL